MAFKDDVESLLKDWHDFSTEWKLISMTMLVASILSLGSLAENVFKFKGFLVVGISFYQELTRPVVEILQIEGYVVDFLVILGLYLSASWRAAVRLKLPLSTVAFNLTSSLGSVFVVGGVLWYSGQYKNGPAHSLVFILLGTIIGDFFLSVRGQAWSQKFGRLRGLFVLLSFFLMCVVAAISDGLTRIS